METVPDKSPGGSGPGLWLGINGFGRIGKLFTRQALECPRANVVAINDPHMTTQQMGCALQNDSTHGRLKGEVTVSADHKTLFIKMDDPSDSLVRTIACYHQDVANDIPWALAGVDYVVECSGKCSTDVQAQTHLRSARKLIMSHPPHDATAVFVPKVNTEKYMPHTKVLSCASCTTNALAPLLQVVDNIFGVEQASFTTVHAVTPSNKLLDSGRQKGCLDNIVPGTTGASRALTRVLPQLDGKVSGMAVRVPTSNVSLIDVTCVLRNPCTREALGAAIVGAAQEQLRGIIDLCTHNIVNPFPTSSKDYCHDSRSCIVDLNECMFPNERFVKIIAYYDNEWAYAARLLELCLFIEEQDQLHPEGPLLLQAEMPCPIMAPEA